MLTEDYFIRYINQMLAAIARIFGLRTAGQFQEAALSIQQALEELFKLDLTIIDEMDDQDLLGVLETDETLDAHRAYFAGEIFYEKGKLYQAWNDPQQAVRSALRALLFFSEAVLAGLPNEIAAPQEKVAEILSQLPEKDLPDYLLAALYQYFETIGNFQQAEHSLQILCALPEWKTATEEELKSFYQRILEKPDRQIEAGGLSRSYLESQIIRR